MIDLFEKVSFNFSLSNIFRMAQVIQVKPNNNLLSFFFPNDTASIPMNVPGHGNIIEIFLNKLVQYDIINNFNKKI